MSRFDDKSHWAVHDGKGWRSRCKMAKCVSFSNWFGEKCQKHLCITSKRNCFYAYHHLTTDDIPKNKRRSCDQSGTHQITKSQHGKRKANSGTNAGKKNLKRRSSVETVSTVKIGRQLREIKIHPKQTLVVSKKLVRESKAVNMAMAAAKKCDSGRDEMKRVRGSNKVKFMSVLDLCCVKKK